MTNTASSTSDDVLSSQILDQSKSQSYSMVHVEHTGASITPITFNGRNYDEWSRTFQLALMAKGKLGYIDGSISKPSETSSDHGSWCSSNALVTMWIYNTLTPDLRRQISLRPEAKLVWTDIKNRFCQTNEARIYQLQAELLACPQGANESLMEYYGRMTTIWDAILEHDTLPSCACNPCNCNWLTIIAARRERKRVRDFLMGLDERFSNARSQIIGINPLPSLDLIYNHLLQDEGVRNLSITKTDNTPDVMAYAARVNQGPRQSGGGGRDRRNEPSKYYCIACKKSGHSLKFCFQVTGNYPEWWGDRPRPRIYVDPNATDLSNAVFVPDPRTAGSSTRTKQGTSVSSPKAHIVSTPSQPPVTAAAGASVPSSSQQPLSQFDKLDLNALTPSALEELGKLLQARKNDMETARLNGNFSSPFTWIIDTGASHHMSGCLSHFSNLKIISPLSVGLPNGDLTVATQSGDIRLSSRLILRNVLYAANLHCNLLSVSSLLIDTSLTIQFSYNLCLIQDRTSKTVIGAGEQHEGLYYLKGVRDDKAHAYMEPNNNIDTTLLISPSTPSIQNTTQEPSTISPPPSSHGDKSPPQTTEPPPTTVDPTPTIDTTSAPDLTAPPILGRGHRLKIPNTNLNDFIVSKPRPSLHALTTTSSSSGTAFPISHYLNYAKFSPNHKVFLSAVTKNHEPSFFKDVVQVPEWREAMRHELDALEKNNTWTLEDLPPNKKAIGSKWVYKIKYNAYGSIERYKARLVIMGNRQIEGVDYNETFAPTVKLVTVRTLLAIAAAKQWVLHQMDVHNAFLHGDLDEEVYMKPPPGFPHSAKGKVCRLRKSLYGLRQAPRCWYAKLASALLKYGFSQCPYDHSLFSISRSDTEVHVLVYVDDLVICGNNTDFIVKFKTYLSHCFHMKDLGHLKYFLGLEIAHNPTGLFVSQRKYALDILNETGLLGTKPTPTPMEQNHRLALSKLRPTLCTIHSHTDVSLDALSILL
ncbi:uncharacterized protein LOC141630800 [Silene latifolia]|uniref:uncharacterized protein LOC141630800 n=1 Tax=Silene latifolia TaxID=37657 RepID=UPI003D7852E9